MLNKHITGQKPEHQVTFCPPRAFVVRRGGMGIRYTGGNMRLVVTGTRYGRPDVGQSLDLWLMERAMLGIARPELVILGDARGVDTQALRWAKSRGLPYAVVTANWSELRRAAGPERNQRMVDMAQPGDECVAFPDASSSGTWDCIRRAFARGLYVRIMPLNPPCASG